MSHLPSKLALVAALLAGTMPAAVHAQSLPYGDVDAPAADAGGGGAERGQQQSSRRSRRGGGEYGVTITPYIEAAQVATAELSPGNDVVTYSQLAAGIEASIQGRHNGASLSLRYERQFGWGDANDGDTISGIARGYATLVPGAIQIEAGALATRSQVESGGTSAITSLEQNDGSARIYSIYAGPSLRTQMGDVDLTGHYRFGYTKVESPDSIAIAPGGASVDIFDESTVHDAGFRAGIASGNGLPIGVGVGGGYFREDISNLDQRVEDLHGRVDATVQLTPDFGIVGGVGYEKVEVSSKDALRGPGGVPVVGADGRFVTDEASPRTIAYEARA